MRDGLRIIDSDGHTVEPRDLWDRYLDPPLRGRLGWFHRQVESPTTLRTFDGRLAYAPCMLAGEQVTAMRWTMDEARRRFGKAAENGFDGASVAAALDAEGVDLMIIYGPGYDMWFEGIDPTLAAALARAYGRWLADYSAASGGRVVGAGPLPIQDVKLALTELEHAYHHLGIRAFWVRPNPIGGRTLGDRYYDPLYEALQDLDVPLGVHEFMGAELPAAGRDRFSTVVEWHTCVHPMEQQMAMLAMMVRGVFDRFPRLRVGYLEAGCAWVPFWLHRIEEHLELAGWKEAPGLQATPLEYFKRQCFVTCDPDETLLHSAIDALGDENILFATDYPHPDSKYPNVVSSFLELPRVSLDSKRRIMWDNALRFYNLDASLAVRPGRQATPAG
jgi:predicted TIM-barrel fold metal-dependent hydrolase